jgi:hypothetical protein
MKSPYWVKTNSFHFQEILLIPVSRCQQVQVVESNANKVGGGDALVEYDVTEHYL